MIASASRVKCGPVVERPVTASSVTTGLRWASSRSDVRNRYNLRQKCVESVKWNIQLFFKYEYMSACLSVCVSLSVWERDVAPWFVHGAMGRRIDPSWTH